MTKHTMIQFECDGCRTMRDTEKEFWRYHIDILSPTRREPIRIERHFCAICIPAINELLEPGSIRKVTAPRMPAVTEEDEDMMEVEEPIVMEGSRVIRPHSEK